MGERSGRKAKSDKIASTIEVCSKFSGGRTKKIC